LVVIFGMLAVTLLPQTGWAWRIIPGAGPIGEHLVLDDDAAHSYVCRDGMMFRAAMMTGGITPSPDDLLSAGGPIDFASPPPLQIPNPLPGQPPLYDEPAPETVIAHLAGIALPYRPIDMSEPPDGVTDFLYSGNVWVRWSTRLAVGDQVFMRIRLEPGYGIATIDDIYTVADCNLLTSIDIKPGSQVNVIHVTGHERIPVAILSTPDFDATTIDPSTVCFGRPEPGQNDCSAQPKGGRLTDVDHDGDLDLLLRFTASQTHLGDAGGAVEGCVVGWTFAGKPFVGCDRVRVT